MESKPFSRNQFVPVFFAFAFGMVLSNLLHQRQNEVLPESSYLLAYKGIDKTIEELPADLADQLRALDQDYRNKKKALMNDAGLRFYVLEYAQEHEMSFDQAAEQLFSMDTPSEEALAGYYREHQETIGRPFFEVKASISRFLLQQRAKKLRQEALAKLDADKDLIIY